MKKNITLFLVLLQTLTIVFAQNDNERLRWSPTRKLTISDFAIKTKQVETTTSFGQFYIGFKVKGFDFMTKNFNKKVDNFFIKSASWIDTTINIDQSLIYQQTLFDISEIYTRQFRKALHDNRKKIISGTNFIEELNQKYITDFSKRRIEYDKQTKFGTDIAKQKEWEIQIQKELFDLSDFSYEK
ncbi:MAG: hypothetical protein JST58_03990 [Bacteroidetes bacterium]|nr:hypothetical protein [Bacteroidota bacterium]